VKTLMREPISTEFGQNSKVTDVVLIRIRPDFAEKLIESWGLAFANGMRDDISANSTGFVKETLAALREQPGAFCEDFVAFMEVGMDLLSYLDEAGNVTGR